jgi:hypothetical protein
MSFDQVAYILANEKELKEKQHIIDKLDLAEVINLAYIGSQQGDGNFSVYKNWRQSYIDKLNPNVEKNKRTIWDRLTGSAKVGE